MVVVLLVVIGGLGLLLNNQSQETNVPAIIDGEFGVVIKTNPTDKSKSDIYLKDGKTGQETLFITAKDVYRNHYHNAEYHNGNIYLMHRTGGDFGYQDNPNWTDELWKYNQQKLGTMVYSSRGFDFRVSDDESYVAVFDRGSDKSGESRDITFLKNDGTVIKRLTAKALGLEQFGPYVSPLVWSNNTLWLEGGFTENIEMLAKIEPNTYKITKFDLSSLPIQVGEFALNPTRQKIAFSDYPIILDDVGEDEFQDTKATVTIYVYDLLTNEKQPLATSTTKPFHPQWLDGNSLQFDNPQGAGVLTKIIQ